MGRARAILRSRRPVRTAARHGRDPASVGRKDWTMNDLMESTRRRRARLSADSDGRRRTGPAGATGGGAVTAELARLETPPGGLQSHTSISPRAALSTLMNWRGRDGPRGELPTTYAAAGAASGGALLVLAAARAHGTHQLRASQHDTHSRGEMPASAPRKTPIQVTSYTSSRRSFDTGTLHNIHLAATRIARISPFQKRGCS